MRTRPLVLIATALCVLRDSPAFGSYADAVSNLEVSGSDACQPYRLTESTFLAGSFRTGNFLGGYLFGEATLSITSVEVDTSSTEPTGKFSVALWSASDFGVPYEMLTSLSPVEAFTGNGGAPLPGLRKFQAPDAIFLNSSTIYCISATVREGNGLKVGIGRTGTKSESESLPGWSMGDQSYVFENGRPKLDSHCVPYLAITIGVPEPSIIQVGLLGAILTFGLARRSKP